MDLLARALSKTHLESQGYLVSFDVPCTESDDGDTLVWTFDVAAVRMKGGVVDGAVVGALRGWWQSSANLTPSLIRSHLAPGLFEMLSDEAIHAFRRCYHIGAAPVSRMLFFGHASPEKQDEAEELLRGRGIETIYLDRVAGALLSLPASRLPRLDPMAHEVMSLLRGAARVETGEPTEKPAPAARRTADDTQLPLILSAPPGAPANTDDVPNRS
ncbi:hypothetical protein K8I61_04515 [bacterium]|nr:hypothetical protein [bacterium]